MQNFDLENNENGRSMIEMLGVLAIIGVLSVGGIAGYSKAMQKYRINKTIEQITLIAGNVRSFFAPQGNYKGLDTYSSSKGGYYVIKKAKLVPDEMWDGDNIKNVFGYDVQLYTEDKSTSGDKQAFEIMYSLENNMEACIELASHDWRYVSHNIILRVHASEDYIYYFKQPLSVDEAVTACSTPEITVITFGLYIDVDPSSEYWKKELSRCSIASGGC